MSWYTQYRPRQIQELDLTHIREFFAKLMKQGKIPQALLFAGPKGTGKTSTARILGAMLNDPANADLVDQVYFQQQKPTKAFQEPSKNEFNEQVFLGHSFVVNEMDAASNRGIDDIRQLKERTALPPAMGKMSVYILDEVHMLTKEAFNALLKVLEEPPAHVVFILATTELDKVPATIISRCSLVEFRQATTEEMLRSFKRVLDAQKIKAKDEDLIKVVKAAEGSFRDGVKLLELACQSGKFDESALNQLIGGQLEQQAAQVVQIVLAKDEAQLSQFFEDLRSKNVNEKVFLKILLEFLHDQLLINLGVKTGNKVLEQAICQFLLKQLLTLDFNLSAPIAFLHLEITLLEIIQKAKNKGGGSSGSGTTGSVKPTKLASKPISAPEPKAKKALPPETPVLETIQPVATATITEVDTVSYTPCDEHLSQKIIEQWEDLLAKVATQNSTLAALLRSSKPSPKSNGKARIDVYYKFHQEQLTQSKFLRIIEDCGEALVGQRVPFEFILTRTPAQAELVEDQHSQQLAGLAEEVLM